jgi:hypothetical protein
MTSELVDGPRLGRRRTDSGSASLSLWSPCLLVHEVGRYVSDEQNI